MSVIHRCTVIKDKLSLLQYNSASSTGTGIAGQASLVINGAIADLVAMTERVMGNVA